jgi:hydrogenase maturation protease
MTRLVVAGYGSPLRQDDAAGWLVASALAERWRNVAEIEVLAGVQPLPEWAPALAEAEVAYFVDARPAEDGADDVQITPLEPARGDGLLDGHAPGPEALLALAEALYGRRPRAWLVSLPGHGFAVSDRMTDRAAHAVARAVAELDRLIAEQVGAAKA